MHRRKETMSAMWLQRNWTSTEELKDLTRPATIQVIYTILYSPGSRLHNYDRSNSFNTHIRFTCYIGSMEPIVERRRRLPQGLIMH